MGQCEYIHYFPVVDKGGEQMVDPLVGRDPTVAAEQTSQSQRQSNAKGEPMEKMNQTHPNLIKVMTRTS